MKRMMETGLAVEKKDDNGIGVAGKPSARFRRWGLADYIPRVWIKLIIEPSSPPSYFPRVVNHISNEVGGVCPLCGDDVDGFEDSVGTVLIPRGKEVDVSMARREIIPSFNSAFIVGVKSLTCLFLHV